jgi:integrase
LSSIPNSEYIKLLNKNNDKFRRFIDDLADRSIKTSQIYSVGLAHFARFLEGKYTLTLDEIVNALRKQEVNFNVYDLLQDFVSYLNRAETNTPNVNNVGRKLAPRSIKLYVNAVRSYLQYNDVDIVPAKFKHRVKIKTALKYDEQAIDEEDIRNILNSTNSKRLKAYLLVLATGGMRTIEAIAIRFKDIDDSVKPTKIHIRPDYSKTRVARDIYISDEATKYLNEWIDYRFRDRQRRKDKFGKEIPIYKKENDDLVFKYVNSKNARLGHIYGTMSKDFHEVLKTINMNERKEICLDEKLRLSHLDLLLKVY